VGGLVAAWLVGEGIVTWRAFRNGAPPTPGQLVAVSGFFVLLALVAEYKPARPFAIITAVGIDIAAFLQILPGSKGGPTAQKNAPWPPAVITDPTVLFPGQAGTPGGGDVTSSGNAAVGGAAQGGVFGATGGAVGAGKNPTTGVGGGATGIGFGATGGVPGT
jgi:hypothetical protein